MPGVRRGRSEAHRSEGDIAQGDGRRGQGWRIWCAELRDRRRGLLGRRCARLPQGFPGRRGGAAQPGNAAASTTCRSAPGEKASSPVFRRSSITLPSFGSAAGARQLDLAAQLRHVADRADDAPRQRRRGVAHLDLAASCGRRLLARRPPAARAPTRGGGAAISATCSDGRTCRAPWCVWSARPSQPLMRMLVRPHGLGARQHRRQVAGARSGSADSRG